MRLDPPVVTLSHINKAEQNKTKKMTRLFRSKSDSTSIIPPSNPENNHNSQVAEEYDYNYDEGPSTPLISPPAWTRGGANNNHNDNNKHWGIVDVVLGALRKSLVTCSVEEVASSMDVEIGWPNDVKHVAHVTFDSFNGFLGLPSDLLPLLPRKVPSASANVFGVSAKSMQCSYDDRGNSVPTILLMMQRRLNVEGGLKVEGIFRINAENSQEEYVRHQLNNGVVPREIDIHCLASLIKAWFRELPSGILDSLSPQQVMRCNTEDDCSQLVKLLPATEAGLLDWAINLMADVVEHESYNKMNAHNIAMVFAPNMSQMADPLTALMHAVQVMNLLKTLILKTLRERREHSFKCRVQSSAPDSSSINSEPCQSNLNGRESLGLCKRGASIATMFSRSATLRTLECNMKENNWSFRKSGEGEELESNSRNNSPSSFRTRAIEIGCKGGCDNVDRPSFREGVRRFCRYPVFQLTKPAKKTRGLGDVNIRSGGGEDWIPSS